MERVKGTFTATLTGTSAMPKSQWYWRLGRRFAKWLARICGESQYVIDNRIPVNYKIGEDGKTVQVYFTATSDETTMTISGIPKEITPNGD